MREYIRWCYNINPVYIAFGATIFAQILFFLHFDIILWGLLTLAFISIGISHGAIDYLTDKSIQSNKDLFWFILVYILKGSFVGIIWYFFPDLALIVFVIFSAWHFGQSDFNEWQIPQGTVSFLWGLLLLLNIILLHFPETLEVLSYIPNLKSFNLIKSVTENQLFYSKIFIVVTTLVLAGVYRSKNMLFTVLYLLLTINLPLLISFGIYFVAQHSQHGWKHLKSKLALTSSQMLKKAFPYTLMTILFVSFFLYIYRENYLGMFFILLSCISIPHILSMDHFYRKKDTI